MCFPALVISIRLSVRQSIEGMLRTQPGIQSVKVALLAERGVVEYDPAVWDADKIIGVSPTVPCSLHDIGAGPRRYTDGRKIFSPTSLSLRFAAVHVYACHLS